MRRFPMTKRFSIGFVALLVIALVTSLRADAPSSAPAAAKKSFIFDKAKFMLDAPTSWVNMPSENKVVVLRLKPDIGVKEGRFPDVFVITVTPLSDAADHASLDEYVTGAMQGNGKGDPKVKVSEPEDATVDGEPAKRYVV